MKRNKYTKQQRELFVELADSQITEHIWECDLMEDLSPDEFINRYLELHFEKYGQYLDINLK